MDPRFDSRQQQQYEPITDEVPTETITEVTGRKIRAFKNELFGLGLFVVGAVAAIDPDIFVSIVGPRYGAYALLASGVSVYILRRYTSTPAEPLRRGKK
jgi:ABC-type Fe3+-hydroxamate transport system substrate-binding protein